MPWLKTPWKVREEHWVPVGFVHLSYIFGAGVTLEARRCARRGLMGVDGQGGKLQGLSL